MPHKMRVELGKRVAITKMQLLVAEIEREKTWHGHPALASVDFSI